LVGQLFVELMEHSIQDDLHIELSLKPIYQINLIEVSFRVEPAVCRVALENEREPELPNLYMISQKMQH
jgi:hypothetical protein